jgi:hypothetical protein
MNQGRTKQCSGLAIKSGGVVRVRSRAADCVRSAKESQSTVPRAYLIQPAVAAPIIAIAVIIWFALTWSPWALIGIPFAVLGTICGQPNLNLADGCLALAAVASGLLITTLHRDIGFVIAASSLGGMLAGAAEKTIRAVPYDVDATTSSDEAKDYRPSDTTS